MRDAYGQLVLLMRKLFHTCRLIHADLSEYNILYFQGKLFIIDVSQSVEHDHPHSMEFLKKDVENMTRYFQQGVSTHWNRGAGLAGRGRGRGGVGIVLRMQRGIVFSLTLCLHLSVCACSFAPLHFARVSA
jgi:serine/threonine-protein kinase RIO1